jgi:hypothetical protein
LAIDFNRYGAGIRRGTLRQSWTCCLRTITGIEIATDARNFAGLRQNESFTGANGYS